MIHPTVRNLFVGRPDHIRLFGWVCQEEGAAGSAERLEEFVRLHVDASSQVAGGIREAMQTDLSDPQTAGAWADTFLEEYDGRIRGLRRTSDRVFDTFRYLRTDVFAGLSRRHPDREEEIGHLARAFSDSNGPLIGKIIFAYRELWFLARHIRDPGFETGSVRGFLGWAESNLPDIARMQGWLEAMHGEALRCVGTRRSAGDRKAVETGGPDA